MGVFNKLITCDTAQPLYVQSFTGYFSINISSYVSELVRKFLVLPVNQLTEGLTNHERGGQFGTNPYVIHVFLSAYIEPLSDLNYLLLI